MNEKRQRFCREYVIDLNATQAYIRAGYSPNGASQSAEKLLRNSEVARRISDLQEDLRMKNQITLENVINELSNDREAARLRGAYGVAIRATVEIAKLNGLYELHNKQENDINERIKGMSQEEKFVRLDELVKKKFGRGFLPLEG